LLETRDESRAALAEIMSMTGWSMRELARKAQIDVATVSRLTANPHGNLPYVKTRQHIQKLLLRIRKKYAEL
jgi:lambda repressor-like predicted transcriptional regulator